MESHSLTPRFARVKDIPPFQGVGNARFLGRSRDISERRQSPGLEQGLVVLWRRDCEKQITNPLHFTSNYSLVSSNFITSKLTLLICVAFFITDLNPWSTKHFA